MIDNGMNPTIILPETTEENALVNSAIDVLNASKANLWHSHSDYAKVEHQHPALALKTHTHPVPPLAKHNHDDAYADIRHNHDAQEIIVFSKFGDRLLLDYLREGYSDLTHSHSYAPVLHSHLIGDLPTGTTSTTVAVGNHSHTDLSNATSSGTANTLAKRDANGRLQVAAPSDNADAVRKTDLDTGLAGKSDSGHTHTGFAPATHNHTSSQISDATNLATANMVAKRDASGRLRVGAPSDNADAVRKTDLDTGLATKAASSHTHTVANITDHGTHLTIGTTSTTAAAGNHTHTSANISDATNLATANMIAKRDAGGRLRVGAPSDNADAVRKQDLDAIKSDIGASVGSCTLSLSAFKLPSPLLGVKVTGMLNNDYIVRKWTLIIMHESNNTIYYTGVSTSDTFIVFSGELNSPPLAGMRVRLQMKALLSFGAGNVEMQPVMHTW